MTVSRFRDLALGWKLVAIVLPSGALGLVIVTLAYFGYEWFSARRTVVEETGVLAQVVAANTAAAVSFADVDSAQQTLDNLAAVSSVALACLYGRGIEGAERLMAAYPARSFSACPDGAPQDDSISGLTLHAVRDIAVRGETLGHLLLVRDLSEVRRRVTVQSALGAGAFMVAMAVLLLALVLSLRRTIVEPVMQLAQKAGQIRVSRNYTLRADKQAEDEIGTLVESFNAMLDEIQGAQRQLVESEKMASLGALVAGVAHEVNTPMGIAVTAASHLHDELGHLQEKYDKDAITHSDMTRFLGQCHETLSLVQTHLQRGVEIISGFKQVAVDQSADYLREFELASYVRDIAQSLSPRFKRSPYVLELKAEPDVILVHSHPGAISQVVSNLVINALVHAFEFHDKGTVRVELAEVSDDVAITVSDDGAGIPEDAQPRIFEPFFTTRRGQGGSGLGLHIVYNLVTQTLKGRIEVDSKVGQGTRFTVRFPRVLKDEPKPVV